MNPIDDVRQRSITFRAGDETVTEPLLRPVFEDLVACEEPLDKGDTPFARRTFVRTAFAYLEANFHWLYAVREGLRWFLNCVTEILNQAKLGLTGIEGRKT